MSRPRRRLVTQQIALLLTALIAGGALYLTLIAPTKPSPRELIDAQLAQANVAGEALEERRTSLAIEYFVKDRNRPPSSLEALVPHYLAEVPRSTESGEPLPYIVVQGTTALVGKAAANALAAQEAIARQTPSPSSPFHAEQFAYNAQGRRDPFKPYDYAPKQEDRQDGPPPLESYELSQLKLTAIVAAGELSSATVEDATGRGFIVRKGTIIGVNRGEVSEILSDKITVMETVTDSAGRSKTNSVVLKLRTKQQEEALQRGRR
jgi:Tfp pilus assembly protein PilP